MSKKIPAHLSNYDPVEELTLWKDRGGEQEKRSWRMTHWEGLIEVEILWLCGIHCPDVHSLRFLAKTAQEAVHGLMDEYSNMVKHTHEHRAVMEKMQNVARRLFEGGQ